MKNVRSASGIILKMCEIVAEYYNLETNGGEGFNKRISVRVDANTNEAWKSGKIAVSHYSDIITC